MKKVSTKATVRKRMNDLLSLNHLVSKVKDKQSLLEIINVHLKALISFTYSAAMIMDKDKQTFRVFLTDPNSMTVGHSSYKKIVQNPMPVNDGYFNLAINSSDPVVVNIAEEINKGHHHLPAYIKMYYESGIKEIIGTPLFNEKETFGLLVLYSDKDKNFQNTDTDLIKGIASLVSIASTNILISESVARKEAEKNMLLKLSHEMAKVRNKNHLLEMINIHLKKIVPFNYSDIVSVNEAENTFSIYLTEQNHEFGISDDYAHFSNRKFTLQDELLESVIKREEPSVFNLAEIAEQKKISPYLSSMQKSGFTEAVLVRLYGDNAIFGWLSFFSCKENTFNDNNLDLIKGVANLVNTAILNIEANQVLFKKSNEQQTLISLGYSIAKIRDKEELLRIINTKLKELFYFTHCSISVVNDDRKTFSIYLTDPHSPSRNHVFFDRMINTKYPTDDGVFSQFLLTDEPVVLNVAEVVSRKHHPQYSDIHYQSGLKEVISIPLHGEKEIWGVLHFYSDRDNVFTDSYFNIIKGVANQLAVAISNIIAIENIHEREREKTGLLKISNEIGKIRSKADLQRFFGTTLRMYFYFTDVSVLTFSDDGNTFDYFLTYPKSKAASHPEYEKIITERHAADDPFIRKVLNNGEPVLLDCDNSNEEITWPEYMLIHKHSGIRETFLIPLYRDKKIWGILFFNADVHGSFNLENRNMLVGVASQISVAVSNILANADIHSREQEKEMLLAVSNDLRSVMQLDDLATFLNKRLKQFFYFSDSVISVTDNRKQTFINYSPSMSEQITVKGNIENKVPEMQSLQGLLADVVQTHEPLIFSMKNCPDELMTNTSLLKSKYAEGACISLWGENGPIGFLSFFSDVKNCFNAANATLLKGLAGQVAIALSNILAHEEVRQREHEKSLLLSFSHDIAAVKDITGLGSVISRYLKDCFLIKEYIISLINEDQLTHSYFLYDLSENRMQSDEFNEIKKTKFKIKGGLAEAIFASEEYIVFDLPKLLDEKKISFPTADFWLSQGISAILGVPLRVGNNDIGILWTQPDQANMHIIVGLADQIAIALSNALATDKIKAQLEEINEYKKQLEEENHYLQEEIEGVYNNEIIGTGDEMQKVYRLVTQVASSNSTVIIFGETGTGKELIARAIHNYSPRRDKLMVKVNCAALPAHLIESELFGHEKGSFTGAIERRIGKFELANNGTLFLDEIGELPLDLQSKLLRVLQEREIERVGGKSTLKVDVRIIAATNRDLESEVASGQFRSDLYYRLNVFPITLPPLRERQEDIPSLVTHFVNRYAKNAGKRITNVSHKALKELMAYSWPGNIRELEHLVERSVLLNQGPIIKTIHLPAQNTDEKNRKTEYSIKTLRENERDHILETLKKCKKVSGPGGAAEILGVPYSTLTSKMTKLGISKAHIVDNPEL